MQKHAETAPEMSGRDPKRDILLVASMINIGDYTNN